MLYIFDIDGVIADVTELLFLIQHTPKNFDFYYECIGDARPIQSGIKIFDAILLKEYEELKHGSPIRVHFVTGRNEISRDATTTWLENNLNWNEEWFKLHMRSKTDRRPAWKVKHDIVQRIHTETATPFSEMIVFEDDSDCVAMYKKLGCYVCHVKHSKAKMG